MKELACQLLGYLKQDLCKLYKEPLFISLLAVTLLIAGLRYLLVACCFNSVGNIHRCVVYDSHLLAQINQYLSVIQCH